jgi:hypothetical protein
MAHGRAVVGHSWVRSADGAVKQYAIRAPMTATDEMVLERLHRIHADGWVCWHCLGYACVAVQRVSDWWLRCEDCNAVSELAVDDEEEDVIGPSLEDLQREVDELYDRALEEQDDTDEDDDPSEDPDLPWSP